MATDQAYSADVNAQIQQLQAQQAAADQHQRTDGYGHSCYIYSSHYYASGCISWYSYVYTSADGATYHITPPAGPATTTAPTG